MSGNKVILGIDPGTQILGYGVIEITPSAPKYISMGVVDLRKEADHFAKIRKIFIEVTELIDHFKPDELAIEAPFYGKNIQSMLKLGRAQGS
ncbi:MAG: crossover junction endodeoxyribonuclease RuvC, partial [Bacteroidales bacterium]|nr:crossover junction endodeoxyribonuclease RuvC [Bacteroidales bacterium]